MSLVQQLGREHRLICEVLDAFDTYARALFAGPADRTTLGKFVAFVRQYVDEVHHAAEEDILFPAMTAHGFSPHAGPIGVMLAEHERGRKLLGDLARAAARVVPWNNEEREQIACSIADFSAYLRAHIGKEDRVLYPLALETLPAEVLAEMDTEGERLLRSTAVRRSELERLGSSLCARFTNAVSVA